MDALTLATSYSDSAEAARMLELSKNSAHLARLAQEGATDSELADVFGVREECITTQYEAVLRKARAQLRGRVRRALLNAGDKGDPRVLEYLAGAYLVPDRDAPPPAARLVTNGAAVAP